MPHQVAYNNSPPVKLVEMLNIYRYTKTIGIGYRYITDFFTCGRVIIHQFLQWLKIGQTGLKLFPKFKSLNLNHYHTGLLPYCCWCFYFPKLTFLSIHISLYKVSPKDWYTNNNGIIFRIYQYWKSFPQNGIFLRAQWVI